jgi:hypothetical protein
MRSKRQQQQSTRRIRRERRRLGRFVVFAEMQADLSTLHLPAGNANALTMSKEAEIRALREQDTG